MKRWLTHGFIVAYLSALTGGIAAHTLQFGHAAHPAMYFVVWDMFCGWSAFSGRTNFIAEGQSGAYYELSPAPWGEFHPFGKLGRRHYDVLFNASHRMALNVLKHTDHEPITRVFVVEECWPKKFNVPDDVWNRRHAEPKDVKKYYHVKSVLAPDGTFLAVYPTWLSRQYALSVTNNPRLTAQARRGRDFLMPMPRLPQQQRMLSGPASFLDPSPIAPGTIPLSGNAN